jgi:hypothetical protein
MSGDEVLYGVRTGTVQDVSAALAARLNCTFEERDSYYVGEYLLARTGHGELQVVPQLGPEDDPVDEKFEEYAVLIYSTADPAELELRGIPVGQGEVERLR